MVLNENERKMVAHLRRQHEGWPTIRWIILLCSFVALAWSLYEPDQIASLAISFYGLSYSLGGWKGRPEVSLLLKIVDEEKSAEAQS